VYLAAYAGGNILPTEAQALVAQMRAALSEPPAPPADALEANTNACVLLPPGPSHLAWQLRGRNARDANAAIELYWQFGPSSPWLAARVSLLEHLLWEPLFDALRTKQQLGYTVSCSSRATHGQLGFVIRVVSATHSAGHCEGAAIAFLVGYVEELERMGADKYAQHVDSAVSNKLTEDSSASEEVRGAGGDAAVGSGVLQWAGGCCSWLRPSCPSGQLGEHSSARALTTWPPPSPLPPTLPPAPTPPSSPAPKAARFFAEVESRQFQFDRAEQEAAQMRTVGQAELAAWMRDALLPGGSACRRLSVLVHPGQDETAPDEWPTPEGATAIESPEQLKAGLPSSKLQPCPLPPLASP
jgi:secreted Zn-dependent insulinase-like peptidase